jgi:hypothetical protein
MHFNIDAHLYLRLPKWSLPLRISERMLYEYSIYLIRTTGITHLVFLDLIVMRVHILGQKLTFEAPFLASFHKIKAGLLCNLTSIVLCLIRLSNF